MMSDETRYLSFEGLLRPVAFHGCDNLMQHLPLVFPGWQIKMLAVGDHHPLLSLWRIDGGYSLQGDWIDEPLIRKDDVDAICALVAELMRAYVRQDERLLCLHGAAAEFGGRLVVFPSHYRAGKSVLCACLAAAGTRLLCDDILPVRLQDGEAMAPGLAPRLRLPLPENLDAESRRFIESHTRLRGRNYSYLGLGVQSMAVRGEQWPIGAFVLLHRQPGIEAALETIGEAEVLAQVVWQNFAREAEAPLILEVLKRLVAGARRFRLCYDRAEDAVELLQQEFSRWSVESVPVEISSPEAGNITVVEANPAPGHYRQTPGISIVEVDEQYFLADRQGAAIHQLNQTGGSIWGLLAEPMTPPEIVDLLLNAFPGLDREQVTADVAKLLQELRRKNLLQFGD